MTQQLWRSITSVSVSTQMKMKKADCGVWASLSKCAPPLLEGQSTSLRRQQLWTGERQNVRRTSEECQAKDRMTGEHQENNRTLSVGPCLRTADHPLTVKPEVTDRRHGNTAAENLVCCRQHLQRHESTERLQTHSVTHTRWYKHTLHLRR